MLRFIARRTLSALLILLIISAITFLLFYVAPRDPARAACGKLCTPQTLALVRHNLGIADPLADRGDLDPEAIAVGEADRLRRTSLGETFGVGWELAGGGCLSHGSSALSPETAIETITIRASRQP